MTIKGFSRQWKDFPDYPIGVTHEIRENWGIGVLYHHHATDIVVQSPMGARRGNQAVIDVCNALVRRGGTAQVFPGPTSTDLN